MMYLESVKNAEKIETMTTPVNHSLHTYYQNLHVIDSLYIHVSKDDHHWNVFTAYPGTSTWVYYKLVYSSDICMMCSLCICIQLKYNKIIFSQIDNFFLTVYNRHYKELRGNMLVILLLWTREVLLCRQDNTTRLL